MQIKVNTKSRFWAKVLKTDSCWLWTGAKNHKGYGLFRNGHLSTAHKYAYELLVGPVPAGLTLDHLCRNRACVNPAHLEPVTNRENCRRGFTGEHNLRKTHCPAGHEYNEANTYIYTTKEGNQLRGCRFCNSYREVRRKPLCLSRA